LVDKLILTLLADDSKNPLQPELQAKHGVSIYIEAKVRSEKIIVLMDTGPSLEIILHNADAMDVDLKKVQVILLSHGHYDHTGDPKFAYRPHIRHIGSPVSRSEIQAAGGIVLTATNPVNIGPGVMSSGEIERSTAFEDIKGFWRVDEERFVRDLMSDDQALIINLGGQGLVIVAGCAHAGIINTIKHAQQVTGVSRVHAVLGGFHLRNASTVRVAATIQELRKIDPSIIGPCHCTGSKVIRRFTDTFQDRCTPLHVGALVEINST
jgi:7,8-dihydropterin-6-yl-methyl-4-(beta-D-ribofuranosyl)aminobenzene 5'-phosphate synthase